MTEQGAVDPIGKTHKEKTQSSADEAKTKSEQERRRNLEVRAGFYDKLSAFDAGSIAVAVSVGVALVGKADSHYGSVHSHLSWLLWIAGLLWLSPICSLGHNSMFVKITGLEAEHAKDWSNYLALISAHAISSGDTQEIVSKHLLDTLHERIQKTALKMHQFD